MRDPFKLKNVLNDPREVEGDGEAPIHFEESIIDAQGEGRLERGSEVRPQSKLLWFLVLAVFFVAFGRLYYLAVARHGYYRDIAEGNRLRIEYIPAPRGAVYDRNGAIIAGNRPSFELVASPLDLPEAGSERDGVIKKISEIVGLPVSEIESEISAAPSDQRKFESILIKQNIGRDEALILNERVADLPGFRVINTPIRDYKEANSYSHLLGYVGKIGPAEYEEKSADGYLFNDSLGKTGLEQIYENFLRGKFGERQVEVDARGSVKKVFGEKPAISGEDIVLNLDDGLQKSLYEALTRQLKAINRKRGTAIAMDPRNGRILAYLSLPSYDNNVFAEGISQTEYEALIRDSNQPLFNRGIGGTYPPGSTIKPLVAAAALESGVVTQKTIVNDTGYILVPNVYGGPDYYFYGYNRAGLGPVDVRSAIALSSDIYFYSIGGGNEKQRIQGLGITRLAGYYRDFLLGQKLGIDLPGEQAGLVPTPEWKKEYFSGNAASQEWYLGDTYHVSIGQGDLLVSPLQALSWTSAIANGGKIYRPHIVDRVQNQDGETVIKRFTPELLADLPISQENLRVVREGMRQTVTDGTARSLGQVGMEVAGKTGTAQFDARNLLRAHAWFVGFAPFDEPEIAIVVMIEDGGEGSASAVPVARAALDWWAKNRYNR